MAEFWMRVRIEGGACIPQLSFLADPAGYDNREEFFEQLQETELIVTVSELQECLLGEAFDADEAFTVLYSLAEVTQLLKDSGVVFLWMNMPFDVRQTFASRNAIPVTRKMTPLEQAMVVLRHLRASRHKQAEWLRIVERYLTLTKTDAQGRTLKSLVLNGTISELEEYANCGQVSYVENALVPKHVATGYLLASFAAFIDPARSEFWLQTLWATYDQDLRYLEQILHTMQVETFFRAHGDKHKSRERSDLARKVEELEDEIQQLKMNHTQEIDELMDIVNSLYKRSPISVRQLSEEQHQRILQGRKIAVVGDDTRHHIYRVLLEEEGAEVILVPGFSKMNQGADILSGVDGVIFVTAYSSHTLYYALKARRQISTYVMVNRGGMLSFKNGILELSKKIAPIAALY
ncbi:hypothetical protein [Alicyclobacillus sp. ALC3]|uniref:hypothetical protein n=1 Tax=Alicyclobacillus sp. ALC3 TaxID=2796143 RepID=UPI002378E780|nr:hypothetical protein [Alicyclobacillus sp. ALC3]WDL99775.1 hypothetical protein JC200_23670 [Alicyclobacillus sp. ALC3]